MEKVELIPTDKNSEYYTQHIAGRHGKSSISIGSKLLPEVSDNYILNILSQTDQLYQKAIDEKGAPGRMVFAVQADMDIGSNALLPKENLDESSIFSTIRDVGTRYEAPILVALIPEKEMPKTNIVHVIMGHYGPTGKAGIYTMVYGDEGMPMPKPAEQTPPEYAKFNEECQKYWESHVFLITPKELKANIAELQAHGIDTKEQEEAWKTFVANGKKSPVIEPYSAHISENATKLTIASTANRMLKVVATFDADNPLDTVVKTTNGKTAYGWIPEELAAQTNGKAAPVIVTEELFDHLDVKGIRINAVAQRGFSDIRDAVETALNNPKTITSSAGDDSFNIFFKHPNAGDKEILYANFMYTDKPVPSYIVRSISPVSKIKGDILYTEENHPNMALPSNFDDNAFEEQITQSVGDRVSGKTWNKGNIMKCLRMHSQEGEYPTAEEFAEIKEWIANGKLNHLTGGNVGMYIKQALEQPNCEIFFRAGKESGVFKKVAPELDTAINETFLETMHRADNASPAAKTALVLAQMASNSEDKEGTIKNLALKYNLTNKDEAIAFATQGNHLIKVGKNDAELLWDIVENITKFKNKELLKTVQEMCEISSPVSCLTPEFKEKIANCETIFNKAPELNKRIGEIMKALPKDISKEKRLVARNEAILEFKRSCLPTQPQLIDLIRSKDKSKGL